MKKLLKSISLASVFCAVIALNSVMAKPVALVSKLEGNAFVIYKDSTKQIREGDYLDDFSTIMTEEGAMITLSDFHDHKYHLAGSGMIKILNKIIELKRGYLLVQSFGEDTGVEHRLQTANAIAVYTGGSAVLSFEPSNGRTQLLVLKGRYSFVNSLYEDLGVSISDSEFSFVDGNYDKGIPRLPTLIGKKSDEHISSMFKSFLSEKYKFLQNRKIRENSIFHGKRDVASVSGGKVKKSGGTVIYRKPYKRKKFDLSSFNQKKVDKIDYDRAHQKFRPEYSTRTGVNVRVFGAPYVKQQKQSRSIASTKKKRVSWSKKQKLVRKPASIEINPQVTINARPNAFQQGLMNAYKSQMRHDKETNGLIDELNSYKNNYKKNY